MMVTFVSQCEKNALQKTRRVLDAFANRIGDNTWQTLITEDGLLTVKKCCVKPPAAVPQSVATGSAPVRAAGFMGGGE